MADDGTTPSRPGGFGTLSSTLIALPSPDAGDPRGRWLFSQGQPWEVGYEAVEE